MIRGAILYDLYGSGIELGGWSDGAGGPSGSSTFEYQGAPAPGIVNASSSIIGPQSVNIDISGSFGDYASIVAWCD